MSRQLGLSFVVAALAITFATHAAHAQVDVQSGNLVALYRFDEVSGTSAVDSATLEGIQTANQNQGTIAWTPGLIGGALDLNGSSSLQAPDAVGEGATAFTISAWVNMDNTPGYDGIYSARNTENWGLNVEGGSTENLHYDYRFDNAPIDGGGSQGVDSPNGSAIVGQWQHLAMTWFVVDDGEGNLSTAGDIYLDGVDIGDAPNNATTFYSGFLSTWNIGDDPCCGGRELDAQLDELAVWNVALSAGEINTIYTNGLNGIGLQAPIDTSVPGDTNGDNLVNSVDFENIRANFGRDGGDEEVTLEKIDGDLVNDNVINFDDYAQWKQVSPKDSGAAVTAGAAVPEPSALLLVGLSATGLACVARRRA